MDFPSMPQWHKGLAILLRNPDKPTIEAGDGLEIDISGTVLQPVVVVIPPRPLADMKDTDMPPEKHPQCLCLERVILRPRDWGARLPVLGK
jgi:hypothetical protein